MATSVHFLVPEDSRGAGPRDGRARVAGARPPVHELFEQQVARVGEATALICGDQRLTYHALNEQANRLARYLAERGVTNETLVGICLRRSIETVVAMLAVLKAGGAYVPLDPEYPSQRLAFMIADTRAKVVITDTACVGSLPADCAKPVLLDAERDEVLSRSDANVGVPVNDRNLIYVMYTSGSTGQPKGVMIEHRSVVRLVKDNDYASFDQTRRFLLLAPISFDASTFEIWGPLLNGATLIIAEPGMQSLDQLGEIVRRHRVDTLWLTGGLFNLMIERQPEALAPLRQLLTGGDAGSPSHFRRMLERFPGCRLINGYGPTETTTFAVCMTVKASDLSGSSLPIGFPIRNTPVWLLDERLNPVASGKSGEICIGGDGVARGYLNQPELTAKKFVVPGWASEPEMRLYRTGDMARYRDDGALLFLGRRDDQIKISGYRVEPGEVACALREHPAVGDAVVFAEEGSGGAKLLVAYLVTRPGLAAQAADLRAFLARRLPPFMLPSRFVVLDAIPLTANGKVDRARLNLPRGSRATAAMPPNGVANSIELRIAAVWSEVLGLDKVGTQDNFFELGGDSLKLIEVHSRLCKQFDEKLPITVVFEYPTIAALVAHLNGAHTASADDVDSRARRQRELLSSRSRVPR
jgi:amino acid adenylation domain-containing protein